MLRINTVCAPRFPLHHTVSICTYLPNSFLVVFLGPSSTNSIHETAFGFVLMFPFFVCSLCYYDLCKFWPQPFFYLAIFMLLCPRIPKLLFRPHDRHFFTSSRHVSLKNNCIIRRFPSFYSPLIQKFFLDSKGYVFLSTVYQLLPAPFSNLKFSSS